MSPPPIAAPKRLVVLVSGGGTNLKALLDAIDGDPDFGAEVAAVGADRDGIEGLVRAERVGIPTFVVPVGDHADRGAWDAAMTEATEKFAPTLVVSAGFMKLLGPLFLDRFTVVNTHPALLPSFPGTHAVRDALAAGVTVTGCTVHLVDAGIDTGPVLAQAAVDVRPDDDEQSLHERIKVVERELLVDVVRQLVRGRIVNGRKVDIS